VTDLSAGEFQSLHPSVIGDVIWTVLSGWWLALSHLVRGVLLCLTIAGIPFVIGSFKIIPVSLLPLGVRIVPVECAYVEASWERGELLCAQDRRGAPARRVLFRQ
jgi:uncharacterized membrane protein YccF (DUF307 family)